MEYYARLFLIVYVGAIVVLFLFIIRRLELKRVNITTSLTDLFSFRHIILFGLFRQILFFITSIFFDLSQFVSLITDKSAYLVEANQYRD